ncbi:cytochrome b [Altererythrobacter aurantiacus]|uniref:Cytochrome b n=1 Tax=Parapontixanthobacter aurantiacus TaxID=1463599 RepID=A0A844ZCL1_9SPHN|nr:cytochrome b [Parapontixanthobacter aurantiacus]MXO84903.1 cytochrome b [Parapontixanthobacter aurantiacus]
MQILDRSKERYSRVAMLLHWLIAIAVITNWRLAEAAEHATEASAGWWWTQHKSLGITILVLSLIRLIWRLTHPLPAIEQRVPTWQRVLARTTHAIFYVLLIGLPLGGWLAISYFGSDIDYWGLFTIPGLPVGQDMAAGERIGGLHALGAEIMLYLIVLHTLGALKHTFFDKTLGIFRMLPFGGHRVRGTRLD